MMMSKRPTGRFLIVLNSPALNERYPQQALLDIPLQLPGFSFAVSSQHDQTVATASRSVERSRQTAAFL